MDNFLHRLYLLNIEVETPARIIHCALAEFVRIQIVGCACVGILTNSATARRRSAPKNGPRRLADPAPPTPQLLTVACPVCHERMRVELADAPQSVACTFCESRVPVPSREQAQRELAAKGPLP